MDTNNTIAGKLARHATSAEAEAIAAGGKWIEELCAYVFPDRSCGRFTDIRKGAAEQAWDGSPIFHMMVCDFAHDYPSA